MSFSRLFLVALIFSSASTAMANQPQLSSSDSQIIEEITLSLPLHQPQIPLVDPIQEPSEDYEDTCWDWNDLEASVENPEEPPVFKGPIEVPIDDDPSKMSLSTRIKKNVINFIVKNELYWLLDKVEAIKDNKQMSVLLDYIADNPKVSIALASALTLGGTITSAIVIKKIISSFVH